MHTCLSLTDVGGHWYVEREVSGLITALRAYCDSIHSCDINIAGPSGEGEARCWHVALRIRIFDEILRIAARVPEGSDSQQSLTRALADVYARARIQLSHVSAQHGDCCAHDGGQTARRVEECA